MFVRIILLLCCSFCFGEVYWIDLTQSEQLALEQNKQVLAMRELYKRAQEGKFESFSKWLPEIEAVSNMYANAQKQTLTQSHGTFGTLLSLTQTLFSSDRYFDVKLAALQVRHMGLLLEALENDILFDVRSLYYKIALDHELIQTAKFQIDTLNDMSQKMEAEYSIGTTIELNVNQSKVAIANAMTGYYQKVKGLKVDLDAFSELLGYEPGEVELAIIDEKIPVGSFDELKPKLDRVEALFAEQKGIAPIYKEGYPYSQERVIDQIYSFKEILGWERVAEKANPLLKEKQVEVAMASENVSKRVGEYLPSVNLVANLGAEPNPYDEYPSSSFDNQKMQWGMGLEVRWKLFDGFGRESRLKMSRYQRNSKEYEWQKERQTTFRNVRDKIYEIEESMASLATSKGNVVLADQTVVQARDQLQIGTITIYDFQLALNNLIEARNLLSQSSYQLVNAYYGLRQVSGIDAGGINEKDH